MNIASWLNRLFSRRGKALALYRRGMAKAKQRDQQGAIDDYTAVIDMPDAPADVRAMALYNRAVVRVAAGDKLKGTDDLHAVLEMNGVPDEIKAQAKQKIFRMGSRTGKGDA